MLFKLPETFIGTGEVKDFWFSRLYDEENFYIYMVNTGDSIHYEAFEKKSFPICLDFANRVYSTEDFKEVYPKSKDFGVWAWTSKNLDRMLSRFGKI